MPEPTQSSDPDLTALTGDYDITGELAGRARTTFLIAARRSAGGKRRDDSSRVLIEIVRPPEGDEAHALDHLASDTKTLSGLRHRRLVCVFEGRWLDDDTFAVVREHVDDPTVADLLARGDVFTNTRIAAILREVHGLLRWAREANIVHRRVTTDRVFLEPTTDRVRVSFAVAPMQRVRTTDAATEDVVTVVRLATEMLTGKLRPEEAEGRSFAELRPDLPARLHEETARLLSEPATDSDLTLYLALIGMADPVAEGETERDRIRAEILEEQRVEREKLAIERADVARMREEERRRLAEEGEELRGAFAQEKAQLEREFAAAQRLLDAERVEMQRIIAAERAELVAKRDALAREMDLRLQEIERLAAADRAKLDELRARIQKDGEIELERKRAAALEDLDDSEIKLDTGKYATPRFVSAKLAPLPDIAFQRTDHLARPDPVDEPRVAAEPWSVLRVVRKLRTKRRTPVPWGRYAVRGGIAAAILITAGAAVMIESRTPDTVDTRGASAPVSRAAQQTPPVTPPPATAVVPSSAPGTPTYTTQGGAVTSAPIAGAPNATAPTTAAPVAAAPNPDSVAARARRDSVRRARAASLAARAARADTTQPRPATAESAVTRSPGPARGLQELMELRDSLEAARAAQSGGAPTQQETGTAPPR